MTRGNTAFIPKVRARLWQEQRGVCYYCSRPALLAKGPAAGAAPDNLATIDHIIPRSKGGAHAGNMVMACHRCNNERGDADARLFLLQKQGEL